jgi:mono/diheme cytochrome c family protein
MNVWRRALWGFAVTVAVTIVANQSNPLAADAQARRAGAKLYPRECQSCHGPKREGIGEAPPLNSADVY